MKYIAYLAATFFGFVGSYVSVVFMSLGEQSVTYAVIGFLVFAHIGSFVFAYKRNARGDALSATLGLVSPPFVLYFGMFVALIAYFVFVFIKPASLSFTTDCQTAGISYFHAPNSPVRSIAYDWDGEHGPDVGSYEEWFWGRLKGSGWMSSADRLFEVHFDFSERKHDPMHEGLPPNSKMPYVRFTNEGKFFGVESLTADVIVKYHFIHPEERLKAESDWAAVGYDLTVTDRRDGQQLATMRYFVDRKNYRICGPIKDNILSEKAFLAKALGFN